MLKPLFNFLLIRGFQNLFCPKVPYCLVFAKLKKLMISELKRPTSNRSLSSKRPKFNRTSDSFLHEKGFLSVLFTFFLNLIGATRMPRDREQKRGQNTVTTVEMISTSQCSKSDGHEQKTIDRMVVSSARSIGGWSLSRVKPVSRNYGSSSWFLYFCIKNAFLRK